MKIKALYNKIFALMFLIFIFAGLTLFIFLKEEEFNMEENRMLAKMPEFNIGYLDPFPLNFDRYYSDHFPYRSGLVKTFNKINFVGLKISPLPDKVLIGLNNFIFVAGEDMETYLGKDLFKKKELQSILEELTYRRDFCLKEGAKFYFVILPQKQTIYEEFIPKKYRTTKKETNRTKLEAYLKQNNFPFIDPTDFLMEKKTNDTLLYLSTDHHWNMLGSFYASQYITDIIRNDFPQIPPLTINDYVVDGEEIGGGNIAQMLNMSDELTDFEYSFKRIDGTKAMEGDKTPYTPPPKFIWASDFEQVYLNPEANTLKAVIICESFGLLQLDFYKESFGKTVLIFDAWQHDLNPEIIKNEEPDIVVVQVLETMLNSLLEYQSKSEELAN